MRSPFKTSLVASMLAFAAAGAQADASVPYTFSAGSPAKAADVNANFSALVSAINAVGARVSKLEGQVSMADLAGTYSIQRYQSEVQGDPGSHIAAYVAGGTVTLGADGNGSFNGGAETGTQVNLQSRVGSIFNGSGGSADFTWSYANGVASFIGQTFNVVAGGRLMINVSNNPADGTAHIMLLTRTN